MEMHMMRTALLVFLAIGTGAYFPIQAADGTMLEAQQQILDQKEQNIASRLTEERNASRLRQGMTKTAAVSVGLEAFVLPQE